MTLVVPLVRPSAWTSLVVALVMLLLVRQLVWATLAVAPVWTSWSPRAWPKRCRSVRLGFLCAKRS